MSCNQTYINKPYTGTASPWELTIAADNGAPTAGDSSVANVTFAPQSGVNVAVNRLGPREVMIKSRFTGAGAALADVTAILWLWDKDSSQWYASNMVPLRGVDAISATGGSMAKVDMDPNARLGYIEIDGLDADEDAVLIVTRVL